MSDTSVLFSILAVEKVSSTLGKIPGAAAISGAAIGAALMGSINKAMDQESAANTLAAQLGGGQAMAGRMGKIAGKLYSQNFGDSIEDIDDALKGVWQNHLVSEDAADSAIQAVTAKVVTSAKLMGGSYDEVSRTVSQMLRTGMAKSADEAFDVLIRGMQEGVNKSDDLLDTFNEYPTEFRKLGLDGTTAMGLLSQAIRGGARDSDIAADALKEFSIRAVDGSTTTAQGFKMLGLNAHHMAEMIGKGGTTATQALQITLDKVRAIKDPVLQAQAATALFGSQAEDLGAALFKMDPSTAAMGLGRVAGAADAAGKTMSAGAGAQIQQFTRNLKEGFVQIVGGKVIPYLDRFASTVASVGAFARNNWSWLGPVVVGLGTFAGVIGTIVVAYKTWKMITEAYTAVQAILNAVMSANPIGLIVIAVAALVIGLIYAYRHSEKFRQIVQGAWTGIKTAALATWSWISGTLWPGIKGVWDGIAGAALWLWHNVLDPFWQFYSTAVATGWQIISSFGALWWNLWSNTIGAGIMWLWHSVLEPLWGAWKLEWKIAGDVFTWLYANAIAPAWSAITAAFGWGESVVSGVFGKIVGSARWVGDTLRGIFGAVGGYVGGAFSTAAGMAKGGMNEVIRLINRAVGYINDKVIDSANRLPGVNFPHLPTIPGLYAGGIVKVGERGTEIVRLPSGSAVYPHGSVPADMVGGSGTVTLAAAPGDRVAEALLSILRPVVRARYGGSADAAVGGAR